jgi:microcystin-dependent protein
MKGETMADANPTAQVTAVINQAAMPIGSIISYAGSTDPPVEAIDGAVEWLLCDGRTLDATTYSTLFALIRTSFGNGTENNPKQIPLGNAFNIPDLRGRFIRGTDDMGGQAARRDPDVAQRTAMMGGGNTGQSADKIGSVQPDAFQGHAHSFSITTSWEYNRGDGIVCGANSDSNSQTGGPYAYPPQVGAPAQLGNFGAPHLAMETRPANVFLNFVIRVR